MTERRRQTGSDVSGDQTFQDGTLDDGIIPIGGEPRGGTSPDWAEPERDHGHTGEEEWMEEEEVEVKNGGWRWTSGACSTTPCRQGAA